MSKLEEIESVIAQLSPEDFKRLASWMNSRQQSQSQVALVRDHSAFLNSYDPADEGLYDDAPTR